VSQHLEIVFSSFLRDDTPTSVLDELRWHLGLSPVRPVACTIDYADPQLLPNPNTFLPGGEAATLQRQLRSWQRGVAYYAWGLHARLGWLDDQWANLWLQVAVWLAPHADQDGYAGFFREESADAPSLLLVRGGRAYLHESGGQPLALSL
jgi:hypothetical protein